MWSEWEERGDRPEKATCKLMNDLQDREPVPAGSGGRAFQIGTSKCKGPEVSRYIQRKEGRPVWQEARGWRRRQG